jgi:predicted DsbA family dithiol-disulfide isomerase
MKVEIWSDFACPFCYIGKTRFENVLNTMPFKDLVEVEYKAYQLNPNAPKVMEGNAYEAFAKGHNTTVEGAKQRFKMFTENAKTVGLTYNYDIIQMTNTFDAHRLAKWANTFGKEAEITTRFMRAYFTDGVNLADQAALLEIVKELGYDTEKAHAILNSDEFSLEVKNQITEARQVGVQGVPFFVINRKFGISGAQQEAYFKQALEQIYEESKPIQTLKGEDAACDDEGCSIDGH